MLVVIPRAVTSWSRPAAYWCTLNGARRTKRLAYQPQSPSPACPVIALTHWPPTIICCVQSPPATPMTLCCHYPTAVLSLAVISREHYAGFLGHWGSPRQPSHCMPFAGVPPRTPFRTAPTSWPLNSTASGGATLSLTICSRINDSPLPCPRPWPGPWISICNFWGCHPEGSGLTLMNTTLHNELFSKPHFLWHLVSQFNWTRHLLVFNIPRNVYWRVL